MGAININVSEPAYTSSQTPVVFQQQNAPKYPELEVILAPSTDTNMPTYSSGRIMAKYGSDAPAGLQGTYVNYDPASSVNSQKIPVAIICDEWALGLTGVNLTSEVTATNTINTVNVCPNLIGQVLFLNAIVNGNEAAVVTGFNAYFNITTLQNITVGQTITQLISIQGVAA